jgi:lactate dehydrogenase-like 2-hydroxyacid dehydrogenase
MGVKVGHTPGVLTETVADTAFALMAAIVRRLPEGERLVREGRWGTWSPFAMLGGDLHHRVLGIVGMGRVGRAMARRAEGFDMEVLHTTPRLNADAPGRRVPLTELLHGSDIVVLSAPLTEATRGMIGQTQLNAMKPDAYLVNVARGPLVDTDALVVALQEGRIAGAALDVVDPEPLPADHPLLRLDNCLVTPHIGSASVRARRAMAALAVDNLIAGLDGAPMPAEFGHERQVDFDDYPPSTLS